MIAFEKKTAILDEFSRPMTKRVTLRGRYDAAQTGTGNAKHWAGADGLSTGSAITAAVRKTLRQRSRYELSESNSYGVGICRTLAADTLGTGPRLNIDAEQRGVGLLMAARIEREFLIWSRRVRLDQVLRTHKLAKTIDGEAFLRAVSNPVLDGPVKLDLRAVECDRVRASDNFRRSNSDDGIEYDDIGNPTFYEVSEHPGGYIANENYPPERVPAASMIHSYRVDRPGQRRGVPELQAALPLFADLRRYTLATLAAAEVAADISAIAYTNSPAVDPAELSDIDAAIPIVPRSIVSLPEGWELKQFQPTQPCQGIAEFKTGILEEIGRTIGMPLHKTTGNSSGYNFASGKIDMVAYWAQIEIDRRDIVINELNTIVNWYLDEFAMTLNSQNARRVDLVRESGAYTWRWPARPVIDPVKEVSASMNLWERALISDEDYLLSIGKDPEEHWPAVARGMQRRQELGLPLPGEMDRIAAAEVDE